MRQSIIIEVMADLVYKGICKLIGYEKPKTNWEDIWPTLPKKIYYKLPTQEDKQKFRIPIGESFKEKILYWNPLKIPHILCSGATGSGKSVCTKSIITSILNMFNESQAELILIDFKVIELNAFRNCKQVIKYTYEVDEALEIISDLLCECRKRYKLFQELEVTSLKDYNLKSKNKLKYQFIFIEEFIVLSQHKRGIKMLQELISLSRASGQFIYISCQRPDHTVISPIIKANVGNKICFHTEDTKNSIIILDREGGEKLSDNGHGLLKQGSQITEFRGYYISDNKVKENIKQFIKPKTEKATKDTKVELKQNKVINDKLVKIDNKTPINQNNKPTEVQEKNKIIDLSFIDNL